MKNSTICLVKDENHEVVLVTTNWRTAAEILAKAHNEAIETGVTQNAEFTDSLSGYHCSIWSGNGKVLAVYGEDNSCLVEENILTAEKIEEDMFDVLNFSLSLSDEDG